MNSSLVGCRRRIAAAIHQEKASLDPMDVDLIVAKLLLADLRGYALTEFLTRAAGDAAIGHKASILRQVASALAGNVGNDVMAELLMLQARKLKGDGADDLTSIRGES